MWKHQKASWLIDLIINKSSEFTAVKGDAEILKFIMWKGYYLSIARYMTGVTKTVYKRVGLDHRVEPVRLARKNPPWNTNSTIFQIWINHYIRKFSSIFHSGNMVTLYRGCSLLTFLGPSTEHNDKCPNTPLYSLTSGILYFLYTLNPKKVPLPGGASQYRLV